MVKETAKMNNNKEIPRWYILHTYSGHEDKVKDNLEQRIKNMDLQEIVHDVLVPTEQQIEIKDGERTEVNKKMYAGYLLVKMIMNDDSWFSVRNTPGVTGFVSAEDEVEKYKKTGYSSQGTINKSQMLVDMHPDVSRLSWRFGRWHHYVNYEPFKKNKLILKDDVNISDGINNYNLVLCKTTKEGKFIEKIGE